MRILLRTQAGLTPDSPAILRRVIDVIGGEFRWQSSNSRQPHFIGEHVEMVSARANKDYPRHISLFRGVKRPRGLARFWSAFTFGNGATFVCYDL